MSFSKYTKCKKRTTESEHCVFQEIWEFAYFCCESGGKIACLICSQSISVAKGYNLRCHYESHRHKYDRVTGIVSLQNTTTGEDIFEVLYIVSWEGLIFLYHNRFVARLLAKQKELSPASKLHHIH
ncbi:hypothetical protein PR048_025217 [Dryococelus australis]|uniref:SPIN-DOC-like zinc-finger domain-containing protein n=1 Tax=Dryococelus australis TaxID=614101 RepID=A0ABQ9GQR2_9NEOP|nr:hypothetical protein PR048_025217 [Dryococelus australis]